LCSVLVNRGNSPRARGRRGRGRQGRNVVANMGRGAANNAMRANINPADDSGSDHSVNADDIIPEINLFPAVPQLDGASSDEEGEEEAQPLDPVLDCHPYQPIDVNEAGNPLYQLNYPFQSNLNGTSKTIASYATWTPIELIIYLAAPFFTNLLACTNECFPQDTITMKDLYLYHAFLTLTCYYRLSNTNEYWDPTSIHWDENITTLINAMTRWKFYWIRGKLRGYNPADTLIPAHEKDRGWKIQRPLIAIQLVFSKLIRWSRRKTIP
jgi:hypothetical protein